MARRVVPKGRPSAPVAVERRRKRSGRGWWLITMGGLFGLVVVAAFTGWSWTRWDRLAARASSAALREDWPAAARLWHEYNAGPRVSAASLSSEARAALAAGRAAQAEGVLREAVARDPVSVEPWLLMLELMRVEDRPIDAVRTGWAAYEAVPAASRRDVLRALTLALLADTPDELARRTLDGWLTADPADINARVAFYRRQAAGPRDGGPIRSERIAALTRLLEQHPDHPAVREALVLDLADAGDPPRGRAVLDAWPAAGRDARYYRLLGRWQLDFEGKPAEAVASFRRALEELPHDWKTHYRLARALNAAGQPEAARVEAETVAALREALDPARLGARLDADLAQLDQPSARRDLAELCQRVGLKRLAEAWRKEADEPRR
jgi:thioredoxin-like negative regulator of GroEL